MDRIDHIFIQLVALGLGNEVPFDPDLKGVDWQAVIDRAALEWSIRLAERTKDPLLRELAPQRDTMRQVGQKAMDEIYISWEESVLAAADRYQVILERRHAEHRAGTERTELSSDRFIGTTVDVMDALYDAFHLPKAVHTGIQDNLNGSYQYMKDNRIGMQENVADASEYLKEKYQDFLVRTHEIGEGFRDIGEGFHSAGHEVKEGFKEGWKKITGGKD